jgi:hypothetical protein
VPAALRTEELCIAAVKQNAAALEFVPDSLQTAVKAAAGIGVNKVLRKTVKRAGLILISILLLLVTIIIILFWNETQALKLPPWFTVLFPGGNCLSSLPA